MAKRRIAISGASGLIGKALLSALNPDNYELMALVRQRSTAPVQQVLWNHGQKQIEAQKLENLDTLVHLAGESIAALRWTSRKKKLIRDSRVNGTKFLCENLAKLKNPPRVLLCASAVGYYGNRGDEILSEESAPGSGFLSEVVQEWEAACRPAAEAGIRVVHMRFGMVLAAKGGALAQMLPIFRLGLGGIVGDGRQYMSWISLQDVVAGIGFLLDQPNVSGAMNFVSPHAVTNSEFTKTLGSVLKRPTIFPLPALMARLLMGEMAQELLLSSARAVPRKLIGLGFQFTYPSIGQALGASC